MAGLAVFVFLVAGGEHVAQSFGFSVMEIGRRSINPQKGRGVILGADLFRGIVAGANIMEIERLLQSAVGVIRAAVTTGAADFLTEKQRFTALGCFGQLTWRRNVRTQREIK